MEKLVKRRVSHYLLKMILINAVTSLTLTKPSWLRSHSMSS